MSLETRKVLDMLAEGKISAADAEKLLQKLQASPGSEETATGSTSPQSVPNARFLRIQVDEPGRKPVNIRMPLTFARTGISLVGLLPVGVAEKLKERGIDLEQLRSGKNLDLLHQLDIDVDKGNGKKVRIFCE